MPRFSIRNPYFIVVLCLALVVIGITSIARMPVDLFPPINIPVVVVATFYNGMPPRDIETDITNPLERWFTQASGLDHMESRSLLGVSIIKAYFQPGTSADADVTQLSNLALADLKRLPPGTLPPLVLKFDASSLPVTLVTVKGEGLSETQLHDLAQFTDPQSDRHRQRRGNSRRIRRQVPAGDGLRRSVQAALAAAERHGRRQRRQRQQPDSPRRRRQDRAHRFLRLFEQPGEERRGPEQRSHQDRGHQLGFGGRHRRGEGRQPASVQHRPHRRPEVRLHPHHEVGRRQQYHPGGQRRPRSYRAPVRPAQATGHRHRFRPIGVRQGSDQHGAARGRHRTGADRRR